MKAQMRTWDCSNQMIIEVGGIRYGYVFGYDGSENVRVVPDEKRGAAHSLFFEIYHSLQVVAQPKWARGRQVREGEIDQEMLDRLREVTQSG